MQSSIDLQLQQLVASVFALSPETDIRAITRADGGAWDSLRHVELLFAVEDAFNVQFTEADFGSVRDYASLLARIVALRGLHQTA